MEQTQHNPQFSFFSQIRQIAIATISMCSSTEGFGPRIYAQSLRLAGDNRLGLGGAVELGGWDCGGWLCVLVVGGPSDCRGRRGRSGGQTGLKGGER